MVANITIFASVLIFGHANAHYIESDFSGEIEVYTNIGFANHIGTLTSDLMAGGLQSCDSLKIKSGIWEIFYPGGAVPSCLLRPGNYDNLFNPVNCDDGSRPIIINSCTGYKLRRDIMRREENEKHDASLWADINGALAKRTEASEQADSVLDRRLSDLNDKINNDVVAAIEKLPQTLITSDLEERVSTAVINTLLPQLKAMVASMKQEIIDELGE